ncbi:hypothetical protein JVU11DRAFT_5387 [Chiua virens]|nr:hypothetical protein JVU11DRAFT_5387 [Chiua virens]
MASSYSPADYPHINSLPPIDHRRLVMSTWHVLEQVSLPFPSLLPSSSPSQPPPPSLREILGAYRARGDGDREMLISMLNAKSTEDQRMAAVASLHKTLLDLYTTDAKIPPVTPQQYPLSSPHVSSPKDRRYAPELSNGHESTYKSAPSPREPPHQSLPPRKRQRYSRSPPPPSHHEPRTLLPSARDLPPSPYSSRSDSEEYSPRSRAPMAIGSLLSSRSGRDSPQEDSRNSPDAQSRFSSSAIGV